MARLEVPVVVSHSVLFPANLDLLMPSVQKSLSLHPYNEIHLSVDFSLIPNHPVHLYNCNSMGYVGE